jgi:glycosyltransferase involved in cell wall biosynthesis
MNKVRICHLTSVHPRYDVRIFFKECKYLSVYYDVYLLVADGKGNEEIENIHIIDIGKPAGRLKRMFSTSYLMYYKAIDLDCNIYHFHDPELIFTGAKLVRKGKKVIYDVHEDVPRQIKSKYYYNIFIRVFASFFIEKVEKHFAPKFNAIITATEYIKKRFQKMNHLTEEVCNFPIMNSPYTTSTFERGENRICYIGGISAQRGIKELIEIFDKNNDYFLELAGEIESSKTAILINSIDTERIKYRGVINREEVEELIGMSKIGLVLLHPTPNHLNSLPIKMFEYMAGGIPVIASEFPLWKRIIEDNNCGICVNPFDLEAIRKAIRFLIDNEEERVTMGENGRNTVLKKYLWDMEAVKLHGIYRKLA